MVTLGERLRSLIDERSLKQKDVAQILGITPSTIHGYITNSRSPDIDMQKRIAEFFNVTVDYLIGYSEKRYSLKTEPVEKDIYHLSDELFSFVNDPNNVEYITHGKRMKDKGIDTAELNDFDSIITSDNFKRYLNFIKKLSNKGINPDDILEFSMKVDLRDR